MKTKFGLEWLFLCLVVGLSGYICILSADQYFDYLGFYSSCWKTFLEGQNPWIGTNENIYPPGFLVFAWPFAIHPLGPKLIFLFSFWAVAFYSVITKRNGWVSQILFALFVLHPFFIFFSWTFGIVDTFVFALFLFAYQLIEKKKNLSAGLLLGAATSIKLYPVVSLLIFMYNPGTKKIRWRLLGGFSAAIFIVGLISTVTFGFSFLRAFTLGAQYEPEVLSLLKPLASHYPEVVFSNQRYLIFSMAGALIIVLSFLSHRLKIHPLLSSGCLMAVLFVFHPSGHLQYWLIVIGSIFCFWMKNKISIRGAMLLSLYSAWLWVLTLYHGSFYAEINISWPVWLMLLMNRDAVAIPNAIVCAIYILGVQFEFKNSTPQFPKKL